MIVLLVIWCSSILLWILGSCIFFLIDKDFQHPVIEDILIRLGVIPIILGVATLTGMAISAIFTGSHL